MTRFGNVAILAIFRPFWRQIFCPKLPKKNFYKSFDVDIFRLEKLGYLLWRQIWRFLPKCWRLFCPNTWSLCCLQTIFEMPAVSFLFDGLLLNQFIQGQPSVHFKIGKSTVDFYYPAPSWCLRRLKG